MSMAKRPRVELNQFLHYLSDDEWAAEGSDDDLGMDEDPSYFSPSSDEGIITPSHYYKTSTMKAKIINSIHVKIDDMDLDQPLSTHDLSSPGQASHSSLPREQLPVIK